MKINSLVKVWITITFLTVLFFLTFCSPKYLLNEKGEPIKIFVIIDKNSDSLDEASIEDRVFLAEFIQKDLKRRFRDYGFLSVAVEDSNSNNLKNINNYILKLKIDTYTSKRRTHMFASLILIYDLRKGNNKFIKDKQVNNRSMRGGTFCALDLNRFIDRHVVEKIKQDINSSKKEEQNLLQ